MSMIIDSGVSYHILLIPLCSIPSPKNPHFITLANGSKVSSKGVAQVSLSPSLNLNCSFCSYLTFQSNFIKLINQVFKLFNSFFDVNSFVIRSVVRGD